MLNQSFTAENFRKIFDYENRKGIYLEGVFFPKVEEITKELKKCAGAFKELKKKQESITVESYEEEKLKLNEIKQKLKDAKEKLLAIELEKISSHITNGDFNVNLSQVKMGSGKTAYVTDKSAATYFALKQIQYNIHKLYKVKQSNRYNILCQLRELLGDKFPKYVIRTDVQDFFESIPRNKLLNKINEESLLTLSSKKIIKQILQEFTRISGASDGIPRGVGISAYLSELYMRSIDEAIKAQSNVIFYARYVDDIIVIYAPGPNSDVSSLLKNLTDTVASLGLTIKKSKTECFDLRTPKNVSLDYLGYNMLFGSGDMALKLSQKKLDKYRKRIKLSFDAYHSGAWLNEKQARKILIKRVKFLTGNTRLLNNKRNAVVGIYFSNSLLTCLSALGELDVFLQGEINKLTLTSLRERLNKMSFTEGFTQRKFAQFSTSDLSKIVGIWKHVA